MFLISFTKTYQSGAHIDIFHLHLRGVRWEQLLCWMEWPVSLLIHSYGSFVLSTLPISLCKGHQNSFCWLQWSILSLGLKFWHLNGCSLSLPRAGLIIFTWSSSFNAGYIFLGSYAASPKCLNYVVSQEFVFMCHHPRFLPWAPC